VWNFPAETAGLLGMRLAQQFCDVTRFTHLTGPLGVLASPCPWESPKKQMMLAIPCNSGTLAKKIKSIFLKRAKFWKTWLWFRLRRKTRKTQCESAVITIVL